MLAASFFAFVVSCTTASRPIRDTKRIITVRAHGRMRLLNGFEARLRLLFTGRKTSLRAYWQAKLMEKAYTALGNNRKRRTIYTRLDAVGFGKIGRVAPSVFSSPIKRVSKIKTPPLFASACGAWRLLL